MKIIIIGPQGSGKSTQAVLLAKKLNIPHISTGDIFRNLENSQSPLGKRVFSAMSVGELVTDEDTMSVVGGELEKDIYKNGFIMDGFPRNLAQAHNSSFVPDLVIYIKIPKEVCIERLISRKREDDNPESIKNRLDNYYTKTQLVLDYYQKMGLLREVDGEDSIGSIQKKICTLLA